MMLKYFLFTGFLIFSITSCSKKDDTILDDEGTMAKPTATFSFKISDQKDPFTFEFNNKSTNYSETRWSFDDDSTSSEASPIHTFLKTGTFNVTMITLNEEGYWAQREESLSIIPEDIIKLVADPSEDNLTMSYDTQMEVNKVQWLEQENATSYKLISEQKTMQVNLSKDEFKTYYVTTTSPKGSTVSREMLLSKKGVVKDLTNITSEFIISHENNSGRDAGEGSSKLIDNDINTKLYIPDVNDAYFYWQFEYFEPQIVNGYAMTSGNDSDGRDPKSWEILASQDGIEWTIVDSRTDEEFTDRKQTRYFVYDNNTKYSFYRIHIVERKSSGSFQMSEFRMLNLPQ